MQAAEISLSVLEKAEISIKTLKGHMFAEFRSKKLK